MSKLQAAGAIGKTIGYVVWAMNNKYNLEVTVQNKTIKTETGVNTSQVIALLETMHNFGNVEIRITNGGTRYDKETKVGTAPDGNNKRSSTSEETTVYTYDTFEV